MDAGPRLYWLPEVADWRDQLKALMHDSEGCWERVQRLSKSRLDFARTNALDGILRHAFGTAPPPLSGTKPVRLAVLGSSTTAHLLPSIRIGGARRGLWVDTYENEYGQYLQELLDPNSALHKFRPNAVLFAFDAHHLTRGIHAALSATESEQALEETEQQLRRSWSLARDAFGCHLIQQTAINVAPSLLGNNEQRLPGSPRLFIDRFNQDIRLMAEQESIDLLDINAKVAEHGLAAWHDPALWHRSKQEVTPAAAPFYGDMLGRLLGAKQGRSAKCLVLDLDNTLWGGVIGEDGFDGIVLGQGSPLGEGFVALQEYARELARRGIILAVCSKNDEDVALEPFESHPEMVLKRNDIAAFRANWLDKPANLRAIAEEINIGLDALVFLDDSSFERNLVRDELPMVAVPEVPDEPALIPHMLADAGYFEGVEVTEEDRERTRQYQVNKAREVLKSTSTDLNSYLIGLEMELICRRFDDVGLQRTVQLINKTNQFNLTTRRYTEADVVEIMSSPHSFGLQLRLLDRFGDNGIIAIVIGRAQDQASVLIDTWLMSCRVLGRQVEAATLNLIVAEAHRLGAIELIGEYRPTKKNGMVREHYARLGFKLMEQREDGSSLAKLDVRQFVPRETFIVVRGVSE
ncbi:MAG: HAD-IIIC family phosphatase [Steroidobacteraceae bacterium]|jgi:FkbH-like protein